MRFICLISIQTLTVCAGVILPLVETCLDRIFIIRIFFGEELNTFALLLVAEISGPQKCKCETLHLHRLRGCSRTQVSAGGSLDYKA